MPIPYGSQHIAASRDLADRCARTAGDLFSQDIPGGTLSAHVVICPLLDDRGHRQGAFAQSLDGTASQRSLDTELLGRRSNPESPAAYSTAPNDGFLDKSQADQDEILSKALPPGPADRPMDAVSEQGHIDLKQSQLFQRFSELLPTGLAILNHKVSAQSHFSGSLALQGMVTSHPVGVGTDTST